MRITWLGHSGFRIEIAGEVLLVDPWLDGNPVFDAGRRGEAIEGASHVLVSHGHSDHAGDAVAIARERGIPVVGVFELVGQWEQKHGLKAIGFNKGGTVQLGEVAVTLVHATHSSSLSGPDGPSQAGSECGFMIAGEGKTIYFSGDTDVMADMGLFEALHHPQIGILSAGGLYTMDMARAAYAARTFFNFETLIPCHYRTFEGLEQSAEALKAALPGVDVIEPEVMTAIEL